MSISSLNVNPRVCVERGGGGGGGGCGGITCGTHWNQQSETILTNTHIIGEITVPFGTQKPIKIGKRRTSAFKNANLENVCSVV